MRGIWGTLLACVTLGMLVAAPSASADLLLFVNRTTDVADAAIGDHVCDSRPTLAGDQCTLRAAIQETNAEAGADRIAFNIAGPGVKRIAPTAELPAITDRVQINGYTQGVAVPNTKPLGQGDNAKLLVELSGESAPSGVTGLTLEPGAAGSVIKGLVINRVGTGLFVKAAFVRIEGNFIGTTPSGRGDGAMLYDGIFHESTADPFWVGGSSPDARNIISGTGASGISGTGGVYVEGNFIGTQRDGTSPLPNAVSGIRLYNSFNTIGGPGYGNVIAFNGSDGITMFNPSQGNRVIQNRIFSNGGLGIDLNDDGITPNDPGDADMGPNGLQNFPNILSATRAPSGAVTITGRLGSAPDHEYTLEFFASQPGGAEGQRPIGYKRVTTNGAGLVNFRFHPASSVPLGDRITATTIDVGAGGSTSEFSYPRRVVAG
jgi:hypothetical protein